MLCVHQNPSATHGTLPTALGLRCCGWSSSGRVAGGIGTGAVVFAPTAFGFRCCGLSSSGQVASGIGIGATIVIGCVTIATVVVTVAVVVVTGVVIVAIITVWKLNVGISSRCAFGRDTMDADVGGGCGSLALREADCLGDGYELLLVRTAKLLESSLGVGLRGGFVASGGRLPSGSLSHSPSSGGVRGQGTR